MKYSQLAHGVLVRLLPLLSALIAVAFIPVDAIGFELPKLLLSGILALCFAVLFIMEKKSFAYFKGETFLWLLAAGVVLSTVFSEAPLLSIAGSSPRFIGAMAWGTFLLLFLGAAHVATSLNGMRVLRSCIVFAYIPLVLHGALQWLKIDPLQHLFASELFLGRTFSFAGHPNTLAQFLVLTLPLFLLFAWQKRSLFLSVFALLGLGVLSSTASRSGLLGLNVTLLFAVPALVACFRSSDGRDRNFLLAFSAAALSIMVVVCFITFSERFSHASESHRSVSSRALIWSASFSMLRERPMGYGPETMALISPRFLDGELYAVESLTATVDRSHNLLLDLLLSVGPLGAIGFLGLLYSLLSRTFALRKRSDVPPEAVAGSLGIVGFSVAALFGFPTALSFTFFFLIAGMVVGSLAVTAPQHSSSLRRMAVLTLALCAGLHTVLIATEIAARSTVQRGQALLSTDAVQGADILLQSAVLAPFDREVLTIAAETHLRLASALPTSDPARAVSLERAEGLLLALHRLTGDRDGIAHALSAWNAALRGDAAGMDVALTKSKSMMPWSVIVRRVGAQARRSIGDDAGAVREEQSIRELLPQEFFREGSEVRRILLKENPWLLEIILDVAY